MYSGTTFRVKSGRVIGVHQKIDRIARRQIATRIPKQIKFPSTHDILHFEGLNGPDGIKRKSPSVDEPWHHINPDDPNDTGLIQLIEDHIENLAAALAMDNTTRAAFEAAWLAHAVTDGLTPAHHDGLAEKIEELWGKAHHLRDSVLDKTLIRGKNRRDTVRKNWEYWGSGGTFSAHFLFEFGVATTIAPHKFDKVGPTDTQYTAVAAGGFIPEFRASLGRIVALDMYSEFGRSGWTRHLANATRRKLIPEIISAVMLAWYTAMVQAEERRARSSD